LLPEGAELDDAWALLAGMAGTLMLAISPASVAMAQHTVGWGSRRLPSLTWCNAGWSRWPRWPTRRDHATTPISRCRSTLTPPSKVASLRRLFDFETDLDGIAEAYAAMDERCAIRSLVQVGTL
jgi:hypothetical protein